MTAAAVVLVVAGVVAWSHLTGDDGPALAEDELEPFLLTAAEVREAATAPGPYEDVSFEASIEGLPYRPDDGFVVLNDGLPECNELVQRVLPKIHAHTEGVAFQRADGTQVLQTLDVIDDDRPVAELEEWRSSCAMNWAENHDGDLALTGGFGVIQGLGDVALRAGIDVESVIDGQQGNRTTYLEIVIAERDGVVSVVTVAPGANLSSPADLALSLAEAADAKLAAHL
jgi:hypothetical protein